MRKGEDRKREERREHEKRIKGKRREMMKVSQGVERDDDQTEDERKGGKNAIKVEKKERKMDGRQNKRR